MLNPSIAADTSFETFKVRVNPCDFIRAPASDLIEVVEPKPVAKLLELRADALYPLEIVRRAVARCV